MLNFLIDWYIYFATQDYMWTAVLPAALHWIGI